MIDLKCLERKILAAAIAASGISKAEISRKASINRVTLNRHLGGPPETMSADNLLAVWQVLNEYAKGQ